MSKCFVCGKDTSKPGSFESEKLRKKGYCSKACRLKWHRAYDKKRRKEAREKHLCTKCMKALPPEYEGFVCGDCRGKEIIRRESHRDNQLCIQCGKPMDAPSIDDDHVKCHDCRKNQRERREQLKAEGKCIHCELPMPPGCHGVACPTCKDNMRR